MSDTPRQPVDWRLWLWRLAKWDGMIPLVVWQLPKLIRTLLPNQRGVIEIVAIALPIAAFLLRVKFGRRHIRANQVGDRMRWMQFALFYVAAVLLALLDCVMVLSNLFPQGLLVDRNDIIVTAVLYAIYFALMSVAMCPGRPDKSDAD